MTLREQPVADPSVPRLELRGWAERYGVVAGITGRGPDRRAGFSLGLWSEENVGQVMTRWSAFRTAFRPAFATVILGHQIHGTEVRWHRQTSDGWLIVDGVDGHATGRDGGRLAMQVARTLPAYLVAPTTR